MTLVVIQLLFIRQEINDMFESEGSSLSWPPTAKKITNRSINDFAISRASLCAFSVWLCRSFESSSLLLHFSGFWLYLFLQDGWYCASQANRSIYVSRLAETEFSNPNYRSENLKVNLEKTYGKKIMFIKMETHGKFESYLQMLVMLFLCNSLDSHPTIIFKPNGSFCRPTTLHFNFLSPFLFTKYTVWSEYYFVGGCLCPNPVYFFWEVGLPQGLLPEVHNEPESLASTATIHCRQSWFWK
jgi:hypothetical protein